VSDPGWVEQPAAHCLPGDRLRRGVRLWLVRRVEVTVEETTLHVVALAPGGGQDGAEGSRVTLPSGALVRRLLGEPVAAAPVVQAGLGL
jgi:hypothetical protein